MASRLVSLVRPSRVQAVVRAARCVQHLGNPCGVQQVRWQSGGVTEASSELVEILNKELTAEQDNFDGKIEIPEGWTMKDEASYQFTLEKTEGNLTISVEVDINNLEEIDTGRMDEPDAPPAEGEGPQYMPNFSITVANKNATEHARFFCTFDEGAEGDMVFTVNEMCLFKPGQEEQVYERKVYHCNAAVLDADMYEGVLKFLESVGVDPSFLEFLIGHTQSYEQGKYIDFIKGAMSTFKA
ncbi:uncharacterized protein LOC135824103 [Sycon ciliatum]|uniref:uncharacterized protein LOC135824103 n=1 Tax=Sycon ciliatum TaxID=27933 RepID=UPI0031F659A5|eukprot:scpid72819/ scgid22233/ 